jgi:hypothetical protein
MLRCIWKRSPETVSRRRRDRLLRTICHQNISAERYPIVKLGAGCSFDGIGYADSAAVRQMSDIVVGDAVHVKDNGTASLRQFPVL